VFSCDYNGWTDVPEAEREGIEAFEIGQEHPSAPVIPRERRRPVFGRSPDIPRLKAA
jgi:hypothetical protein